MRQQSTQQLHLQIFRRQQGKTRSLLLSQTERRSQQLLKHRWSRRLNHSRIFTFGFIDQLVHLLPPKQTQTQFQGQVCLHERRRVLKNLIWLILSFNFMKFIPLILTLFWIYLNNCFSENQSMYKFLHKNSFSDQSNGKCTQVIKKASEYTVSADGSATINLWAILCLSPVSSYCNSAFLFDFESQVSSRSASQCCSCLSSFSAFLSLFRL